MIPASTLLLNLALLEQRGRARRDTWNHRVLRELRARDGRVPDDLHEPSNGPADKTLGWPVFRNDP